MPETNYLKMAYDALYNKKPTYDKLLQYYYGEQPLVYSTDRLQEAFSDVNARFVQNWLSVIVSAALDRLVVKGWDAGAENLNDDLSELWAEQLLSIDSHDAFENALVCGESYFIIWADDLKNPEIYYNDARTCHVFYDPARPKIKKWAAKWYFGDDSVWHMVLYFPTKIEYYQTRSKDLPQSYNAFRPSEIAAITNPTGQIPVFHLKTTSQIVGAITLQDAVNKLFADMMVTSEYGAFPQRYIISNSDTSDLRNAPNLIWDLPAGDNETQPTTPGQFPSADLGNYLNCIDKVANSMAIITRTPKHYFYATGADISGEALLAMESPLVKKVETIQESFSVTFQEMAQFSLKLMGAELSRTEITVVWEVPKNTQPKTEAEARKINIDCGLPLITVLRRDGWSQSEIDQMQEDQEEQDKKSSTLAKELLRNAKIQSEQSNQNPDETGEPPDNELQPVEGNLQAA